MFCILLSGRPQDLTFGKDISLLKKDNTNVMLATSINKKWRYPGNATNIDHRLTKKNRRFDNFAFTKASSKQICTLQVPEYSNANIQSNKVT